MQALGDNAQLLSNDILAKWLIEDFPFRIQLSTAFPFLPISVDTLRYATTGPLTPGRTISQDSSIHVDSKHTNVPNRVHRFVEIVTQFRVACKAQDIFSANVNDQVAVQKAPSGA